jgi:hypothetical protein
MEKKTYDGNKIPLLYLDMDDFSADMLQKLTDELLVIRDELKKKYPKLDLSQVKDMGPRIVEHYGKDVTDTSSLQKIFSTNKGYAGCKTPVVPVEGGVIPNINSRLFTEDIPFGLCILRNLGDMLKIKMPICNFLIKWHQQFMGKKYLLDDDTLNMELIPETGAPIRYGYNDLDKLVEYYF